MLLFLTDCGWLWFFQKGKSRGQSVGLDILKSSGKLSEHFLARDASSQVELREPLIWWASACCWWTGNQGNLTSRILTPHTILDMMTSSRSDVIILEMAHRDLLFFGQNSMVWCKKLPVSHMTFLTWWHHCVRDIAWGPYPLLECLPKAPSWYTGRTWQPKYSLELLITTPCWHFKL